jgi:hypothetical protein
MRGEGLSTLPRSAKRNHARLCPAATRCKATGCPERSTMARNGYEPYGRRATYRTAAYGDSVGRAGRTYHRACGTAPENAAAADELVDSLSNNVKAI